jgi:hypothetical protein
VGKMVQDILRLTGIGCQAIISLGQVTDPNMRIPDQTSPREIQPVPSVLGMNPIPDMADGTSSMTCTSQLGISLPPAKLQILTVTYCVVDHNFSSQVFLGTPERSVFHQEVDCHHHTFVRLTVSSCTYA